MERKVLSSLFIFLGFFMLIETKYDIILEKIENAFGEDDKFVTFDGLRVKKFNRTTFVVDGKYDLKIDVDDNVTIKLFMLNLQGNQYKQMLEKDLGSYCEMMYQDTFEELFNDVLSHFKHSVKWKTCPFPKGKNEIIELTLQDNQDLLPPYLPGGEKWQVQIRFYRDGEVLGGYNVFIILRNENSLLNGGKK